VKVINVNFDNNRYSIYLKRGVIENISNLLTQKTENKKVIIVADKVFRDSVVKKVIKLLDNFEIYIHFMEAGKANKNIKEATEIYSILEKNNIARDSTLIAIGGGVIGDLAGFVASTWYRGMNLVHIPTTLMAMVDSSVGGKVAINFGNTINAIGNYYHPIFTLMDLTLIDTLSNRDYSSGIAESIKCAIISDRDFFNQLSQDSQKILSKERQAVEDFIYKTINIKIAHVQGDIKENNKRLLLNYGHTLGHAIEVSTATDYKEYYRHGEGVSLGIMAVAYIAQKHLNLSSNLYNLFEQIFQKYNLPIRVYAHKIGIDRDTLIEKCMQNIQKDKKRVSNHLRIILVKNIGEAKVYSDIPIALIKEAFEHIIKD